jgi:peptide-methionine (R)-S-oxide reductase
MANQDETGKVVKSDEEWRRILTPEQYQVAREKGTERAFSGAYWNTKTPGVYVCAACENPLFSSDTKFDSGCGWPSYFEPLDEKKSVVYAVDKSHGMTRTEALCARCGAHLGHVFEDGPKPTGLRYCINSVILKHIPEKGADTESK